MYALAASFASEEHNVVSFHKFYLSSTAIADNQHLNVKKYDTRGDNSCESDNTNDQKVTPNTSYSTILKL